MLKVAANALEINGRSAGIQFKGATQVHIPAVFLLIWKMFDHPGGVAQLQPSQSA